MSTIALTFAKVRWNQFGTFACSTGGCTGHRGPERPLPLYAHPQQRCRPATPSGCVAVLRHPSPAGVDGLAGTYGQAGPRSGSVTLSATQCSTIHRCRDPDRLCRRPDASGQHHHRCVELLWYPGRRVDPERLRLGQALADVAASEQLIYPDHKEGPRTSLARSPHPPTPGAKPVDQGWQRGQWKTHGHDDARVVARPGAC
jgi:hypothetical protein